MTNEPTAAAERVRRVRDLEPVEVVYRDDFEGAEWAYSNDLSALAVEYVNQQPTYADLARELAEAKAQAAAFADATPFTVKTAIDTPGFELDPDSGYVVFEDEILSWLISVDGFGCVSIYGNKIHDDYQPRTVGQWNRLITALAIATPGKK